MLNRAILKSLLEVIRFLEFLAGSFRSLVFVKRFPIRFLSVKEVLLDGFERVFVPSWGVNMRIFSWICFWGIVFFDILGIIRSSIWVIPSYFLFHVLLDIFPLIVSWSQWFSVINSVREVWVIKRIKFRGSHLGVLNCSWVIHNVKVSQNALVHWLESWFINLLGSSLLVSGSFWLIFIRYVMVVILLSLRCIQRWKLSVYICIYLRSVV